RGAPGRGARHHLRGDHHDPRRGSRGARRRCGMRKLAINRLLERPVDQPRADRFVARHRSPIVEGSRATFLWVGEADEVFVRHRVLGLPDPLGMRRVPHTTLWYVSIDMPPKSRVEYQFEIVRGTVRESYVNDP